MGRRLWHVVNVKNDLIRRDWMELFLRGRSEGDGKLVSGSSVW